MSDEKLIPLEQKTVEFAGSEILGVKANDGKWYVGVRWVCEGVGFTEGQTKNERKRIQEDVVLKEGGRNFILPTNGGAQDVVTIGLDFLPLWLAKITITQAMRESQPGVYKRLVHYQLKAKDALAAALLPGDRTQYDGVSPEIKAIFHLDIKTQEHGIRIERLENSMIVDHGQQRQLQDAANRKVVPLLGGKDSAAYNDDKLRGRTYQSFWKDYKTYFKLNSYHNTRQLDFDRALEYIAGWQQSTNLRLEINAANSQMSF